MQSNSSTQCISSVLLHMEAPCRLVIEIGDRILSASGHVFQAMHREMNTDDHITGLFGVTHQRHNMFCHRAAVHAVYRPDTGKLFIYNSKYNPFLLPQPWQYAHQSLNWQGPMRL